MLLSYVRHPLSFINVKDLDNVIVTILGPLF